MRRYSLSVLALVAIACFGFGTGLGLTLGGSAKPASGKPGGAINTPGNAAPQALIRERSSGRNRSAESQIAASVPGPGDSTAGPDPLADLRQLAWESTSTRQDLMDRYQNAGDSDTKEAMGALLSELQTADVRDFAMKLAQSSDASQRKDGFGLLGGQDLKLPKIRQIARQALATEQDPAILSRAIATLQPAATEASENAAVFQQIQGLTQHEDPFVRAQAVNALAAWDKTGASAGALREALADPEARVRWAAVEAITNNRIHAAELKGALIDIAANPEEASDLRVYAADALEHFLLDRDEYTRAMQATHDAAPQSDDDTADSL